MTTQQRGRTIGSLPGARAIAEAARLDGREVAALVYNGHGRMVASMIHKQRILDRAATERSSVDWAEFASLDEIT